MFDIRYSMFDIRYSMFDVRCSVFGVRYSLFDIQGVASADRYFQFDISLGRGIGQARVRAGDILSAVAFWHCLGRVGKAIDEKYWRSASLSRFLTFLNSGLLENEHRMFI
jgi:hypothetical protein